MLTPCASPYPQPQVRLDLWGGTSGTYDGLDRFGRVVDQRWIDYNGSMDVDRIQHGYDRNSNRLWRKNTVADLHGGGFDELYQYDKLDRLFRADRGDLNANRDAITGATFTQDWDLDPVGNWSEFTEDETGNSIADLQQARDHNTANEITDITESVGPAWAVPEHDPAGNMTKLPRPSDPENAFTATYDAWNRLVRLNAGADIVAEYEYDGRRRRILKKTYENGILNETRHFYYSENWQVLEERVNGLAAPDRQFVWDASASAYVDDLVCRDRTTQATLDERLYALQDAHFNVTALADVGGSILESYSYTAYGARTVLNPSFAEKTGSDYDFAVGHQGLMHDEESGLVYNRMRTLHVTLGRFVQRDPLGYVGEMSLYEYVHSMPINAVDPSGLIGFGMGGEFPRAGELQDDDHGDGRNRLIGWLVKLMEAMGRAGHPGQFGGNIPIGPRGEAGSAIAAQQIADRLAQARERIGRAARCFAHRKRPDARWWAL